MRDDWTFFDSVALVPLDLLVSSGHASTLDDFDNYGACTDDVDSGVDWGDWEDGGNFVSTLRRTTGCGTVVFENFAPNWNRLWVFDAETGKLVAYGRLDDVGTPPCGNAAYIAGAKRAPCATDVVEVCR